MSSKIMYSSRKYPYSPHRGDCNFQRGEGVFKKIPFCGGGMDIFEKYTMCYRAFQKLLTNGFRSSFEILEGRFELGNSIT